MRIHTANTSAKKPKASQHGVKSQKVQKHKTPQQQQHKKPLITHTAASYSSFQPHSGVHHPNDNQSSYQTHAIPLHAQQQRQFASFLHNVTANTHQHYNNITPHLVPFKSKHNLFSTATASSSAPTAPQKPLEGTNFTNNPNYKYKHVDAQGNPLTVKIKDLPKEYLVQHPEIELRAKFGRIPTREEVTGLVPDAQRDKEKLELPGQKKLREDKMLTVRDEAELLQPQTHKEKLDTIRLALNTSTKTLSESILSLAIAEPVPHVENNVLEVAEANIAKQLQVAPSWDVDDPRGHELQQLKEVRLSEKIFKGNVDESQQYLQHHIAEAKKQNLPYFEPTGNAVLDELNKKNLEHGIMPLPDLTQDNPEITVQDIKQIDDMAQSLARSVEVRTSARQPFDTASKIVRERMKDLSTNPDDFFRASGCPTKQSRTGQSYSRYLKLLAVKGTMSQALDTWQEMKERGLPLTAPMYSEMIACCALDSSPKEQQRMLKEMTLNKIDLNKSSHYVQAPEWVGTVEVLGKKHHLSPLGAPKGFHSAAPQIATYGSPRLRGAFNPSVEYAFYLFEKARQGDIVPSKQLFTQLMKVCGEHKQWERAFVVYEEFQRYANGEVMDPKQVSNKKEIALASEHREAKLEGFKPDQVMATTLMNACLKSGVHGLVEETFHRFWESGLQPDAPMYNLVIRSCTHGSNVEKAFKYFEQLQHFGHDPSIITYTSLIRACIAPDRPEFYPKAFEVFHECVAQGFRPNEALFGTLLQATARQADVNNLMGIFKLMTKEFPHLLTNKNYTLILVGLANSMNNKRLPGYGGYVLSRHGRSLFSSEDNQKDKSIKSLKLNREDRLVMADALYSEFILRTEQQDKIGSKSGQKLYVDAFFLNALISVYAEAAGGILFWDRHEKKEGREDPLLSLQPAQIEQLLQRTWAKVVTLQKAHPNVFKLTDQTYKSLIDMYGAADRLDDLVYHLLYLTRGLKQDVGKLVWNKVLEWCKDNAHHGPALVVMEEMTRLGYPIPGPVRKFFLDKEEEMEKPIEVQSFPNTNPLNHYGGKGDKDTWRDEQWMLTRDKRTGRRNPHPYDYDVSYKDF